MEIKGNGRGCPRGALPKTTKTIKQKQAKPPKPQKTTKSDGNQRKWYGVLQVGPIKNHQNHKRKQKQPKPPKPSKTSRSDGNQRKL